MEEKIINIITGKEPCPVGYEVLKLSDGQWQIWNAVQNCPYCWVDKVDGQYKIIS